MQDYDGSEVKKGGKSKWTLWVVIGIVAVVIIVAVVLLKPGGSQSSASGLTIDDLSAIVTQQSTTIQGLTTWKATTTEELANLNSKQQQLTSQLSGITNPKDWTSDMNKLKADFTALQDSWGSVNQTIEDAVAGINITIPRYVMVSQMVKWAGPQFPAMIGDVLTNIEVYGQGKYPVAVTFYGSGLNDAEVYWPSGAGYYLDTSVVFEYACSNGTTSIIVGNETDNQTIPIPTYNCIPNGIELIAFVIPADGWKMADVIQLGVDLKGGSIDYATATTAGTWLVPSVPTPGGWPL